jgi:hypothetical protein
MLKNIIEDKMEEGIVYVTEERGRVSQILVRDSKTTYYSYRAEQKLQTGQDYHLVRRGLNRLLSEQGEIDFGTSTSPSLARNEMIKRANHDAKTLALRFGYRLQQLDILPNHRAKGCVSESGQVACTD